MKNKLIDLNDHLFAQLERLGDENLKTADIDRELKRTEAIVSVSEQIIDNANISLKAAQLIAEHGGKNFTSLLPAIDGKAEIKIENKAIPDYSK